MPTARSGRVAQGARWGALCATAVSTLWFASPRSSAAAPVPTDGVSAHDLAGHPLDRNPVLHAGDRVVVTASGFRPSQVLDVHDHGRLVRTAVARPDGSVEVSFAVPTTAPAGQATLSISERVGAAGRAGSRRPRTGNVVVVVPRFSLFPYRIDSTAAVDTDPPVGATTDLPRANRVAELPMTGRQLLASSGVAALLISGGGLAVRAARRRHRTDQV